MTIATAIITFFNAWWISLFFVFPFAIQTPENHTPLEYAAAPKTIRWRKLLVVDTVVAVVITVAMALLFNSGLLHVDTLV